MGKRVRAHDRQKKPIVQSVERALDILEALEASPNALRAVDIAEQVGLNGNTASNLLRTLYERGYLAQDQQRRYLLGGRTWQLGRAADRWSSLREALLPAMHDLADSTGDAAFLGALENNSLLCIAMVEGSGVISVARERLWSDSGHASATGKVLLAHQSPAALERFLKQAFLARHTDRTITDKDALSKHLAQVAAQGFAITIDESVDGLAAVGVPVFRSDGSVIAALGQSFPSYFIESGQIDLLKRVETLRDTLSGIPLERIR